MFLFFAGFCLKIILFSKKYVCLFMAKVAPDVKKVGDIGDIEYFNTTLEEFKVIYRSSPSDVFLWKRVLKIYSKFTVEHSHQSAISRLLLYIPWWNIRNHHKGWLWWCSGHSFVSQFFKRNKNNCYFNFLVFELLSLKMFLICSFLTKFSLVVLIKFVLVKRFKCFSMKKLFLKFNNFLKKIWRKHLRQYLFLIQAFRLLLYEKRQLWWFNSFVPRPL